MRLLTKMTKRKVDESLSGTSDNNSEINIHEQDEKNTTEQNTDSVPSKVAKTSKSPSSSQLLELKETENLFQSSLLRLQIAELLNEVCVKDGRKAKIEESLQKVKKVLLSLPDGKVCELSDTKWFTKNGLEFPVTLKPRSKKGNFQFLCPKSVDIVGSFLLGTSVKPHAHVDLGVTMPKHCIQTKDYLNHRYIRKRAFYLTTIAWHLQKENIVHDLHFSYHHGDHFKPFLLMQIKDESTPGFEIHLHVVPESGSFKLNRFIMDKNNVRKYWFEEKELSEDNDEENMATPLYNTAVLQDLTLKHNMTKMQEQFSGSLGLKQGVILLKVWLQLRELSVGYGCFSGFVMTMFVSYLMKQRLLNKFMSSYQVFRNTLLNLSNSNWCENPITLCPDTSDDLCPSLSQFQNTFDVVFVDHSGYTNLCASMTRSLYQRVVHEAKLAVQVLDNHGNDSFEALFLKPVPFISKFDHIFHITDLEELHHCPSKLNISHKLVDYNGDYVLASIPAILDILKRALNKRVHLIQMRQLPIKQWPIDKRPPETKDEVKLTFGFLVDPEFANSVVEKGPAADSAKAKEFIKFWGDKSELRRFQDGVICEAVVWTSDTLISKKRLVCSKIVNYILHRHADIKKENIHHIGSQLDCVLKRPRRRAEADAFPYGTGEEQHILIHHRYTSLTKQLRGLNDLPLAINSIQAISPVFRYTEVFPAVPLLTLSGQHQQGPTLPDPTKFAPPWVPCLEVVCMLETSGKWPEDFEAVRRLKAAFHIQLGKALSSQCLLPVLIKPEWVDVLKDGFVFRIRLSYSREVTVAKLIKMSDGTVKFKDTEASVKLEKTTKILPVLTSTLHGIYQQHNSFSCVSRLAKRWTAAHMLSDHIPDMAVELIVAQLYLNPAPFTPPGSPITGFFRFLQLISTFDWKLSPFIVNLNNKLSAEDVADIAHKFSKERTTLPLMFLSTPFDRYSSHWTKKTPTAPLLRQFVLLAQKACEVLQNQILLCSLQLDFKTIFRPSFEIFDVLIYLNWQQLPRNYEAVDISENTVIPHVAVNKFREVVKTMPVVDYDPVQYYLHKLQCSYDELAMFCYDKYGGSVIGVIWKPAALQPKEFKVSVVAGRMLTVDSQTAETVLVTNFGAILNDFAVLGRGLVDRVETIRVH